MKKVKFFIAAALIVLILILVAINFFFIPNNNIVPAFEEGGVNLVIDGDVVITKDMPKITGGKVSLPFSVIKKYIDPNIYWDQSMKQVTVTTENRIIRMRTDSLNAMVNSKSRNLNLPVTIDNGIIFVPINFLADFYGIEVKYMLENNVVVIDHKVSSISIAKSFKNGTVVRKGRSIHYPVLEKLDGATYKSGIPALRIFKQIGDWYKVRTYKGIIGYVKKKDMVIIVVKVKTNMPEQEKTKWKPANGKINLVWEMIYQGRPVLSNTDKIEGLDVLSPTWFQLQNSKGDVVNRAYPEYVEWAHNNGYKVWALLSNGFNGNMTNSFLKNSDARDNLIKHMLSYVALYKLDGINLDFENVSKDDKDSLTQFFREFTTLMKEQGIIVSVDINMSASYDRKAISDIVDYIMLMSYDQHWRTSPEAGSVAQITWVESVLNTTLEDVSKEKLLLGLPFYTRLWKETYKNGEVKLTTQSLRMAEANELVKDNDAKVTWDSESGQFYAEYKKDGATYKIWLEDDNSINLKSSLVQKYELAGTASWSKGFETPSIWNVLDENLKMTRNYDEWVSLNENKNYVYKR